MRIGIFGGSFNPIHVGHIALARQLRLLAKLDEVWLMVSPQNPLKLQSALLNDQLRYQMASKALQGEEGLSACDYELHLPKPSYTWNTLQHLQQEYPQHTFILLIGGDNWAHFERWRHWKDILRNYQVIVYPRDNHPGTISVPLLNISSTEIRHRVQHGESISGMVPDAIIDDVKHYYGTPQNG
jgi:nicotinate-nucleotide adenylyltransferase